MRKVTKTELVKLLEAGKVDNTPFTVEKWLVAVVTSEKAGVVKEVVYVELP